MSNISLKKNYLLGLCAIIYSIVLLFTIVNRIAGATIPVATFYYFTYQSNILVLIYLVLFAITCFTNSDKLKRIVLNKTLLTAVTVYITLTFFIVALLLTPIYEGTWEPVKHFAELITHDVSAIVMWLYFFLIKSNQDDEETTLKQKIKAILIIEIYPIAYVILNLIIGNLMTWEDGSKAFCYAFVNPETYGNNYIIYTAVILGLALLFGAFGVLLLFLKEKWTKANKQDIIA